MTLQKDQPKPVENRTQRIVKYSIIAVAAALLVAAVIIAIVSGAHLF